MESREAFAFVARVIEGSLEREGWRFSMAVLVEEGKADVCFQARHYDGRLATEMFHVDPGASIATKFTMTLLTFLRQFAPGDDQGKAT